MSLEDGNPVQPSPGTEAADQVKMRTLTDARTLRALAHPVRIAILEALALGGPMTATEVGERIDESPTTCSFHLRQLAKYGLVEEAGGGKGRARPWRITSLGFNIPATHDDPEADVAAAMLSRVAIDRQLARYVNWINTSASYPSEWREAADSSEYLFYLTAGELQQLHDEVHDLLKRWFGRGERLTDPAHRPPGSVPVELLVAAYPMELPKAAGAGKPGAGKPGSGKPGSGKPGSGKPGSGKPGSAGPDTGEAGDSAEDGRG
jgi:DNA-binding transcriptional ArsR family regulator